MFICQQYGRIRRKAPVRCPKSKNGVKIGKRFRVAESTILRQSIARSVKAL